MTNKQFGILVIILVAFVIGFISTLQKPDANIVCMNGVSYIILKTPYSTSITPFYTAESKGQLTYCKD